MSNTQQSPDPIPQEIKKLIEDAARAEEIYEPKYGGKDHSGYDTMMKYEINGERSECFEKGAIYGYQLQCKDKQKRIEELEAEVECVFCGEECQEAPTKRGWASAGYGKGLHFDCARKVANVADHIEQEENKQ